MGTERGLRVEASGATQAPPETLWALLEDVTRYPEWGPWSESGYDRPGDDGSAHGPGAIRHLRYGRTVTVERVLEVEPARRLVYEVVSGIPVRHYRAVTELTPAGTGTAVRWTATFDATLGGRLVRRKLQHIYDEVVGAVIAAAERPAGNRPAPASTT